MKITKIKRETGGKGARGEAGEESRRGRGDRGGEGREMGWEDTTCHAMWIR